jgi:hypothetical protein
MTEAIELKAVHVVATGCEKSSPRKPADQTVRYEFVRDAGAWKIDDIKGASDDEPWSIRGLLTGSLKN